MELKLYTKSHDTKLLRQNTKNNLPFTSKEKNMPYFRTLQWLWFSVAMFF